jgi:hypothetical protein
MRDRIRYAALFLFLAGAPAGFGGTQSRNESQEKTPYTIQEYNAYTDSIAAKDPAERIKNLDQFQKWYPHSALIRYVDQAYLSAYSELKNYPKMIEYADKTLSFSDRLDNSQKLQAMSARTTAFLNSYDEKASSADPNLVKARDTAKEGLALLEKVPRPAAETQEQFDQKKRAVHAFFQTAVGLASFSLKDEPAAVSAFATAYMDNPQDATTAYRLGIAYFRLSPPDYMDGFWALARVVALKGAMQSQALNYLKSQIQRYQQCSCDSLIESQANDLVAEATKSPIRPDSYVVPSAEDLQKVRESSGLILDELKTGGDRTKLVWRSICGLEFPEVGVKVLDIQIVGDKVELKVFRAPTEKEMEAASEPNMEVEIVGQPDAERLKKDDWIRFSGTLSKFQPEPFLLTWTNAKVDPEDIPQEKASVIRKPIHKRPK